MALRSFLPLLKRLVSGIWKWHWRPNKAMKIYNCSFVLRWEIVQSFLPLSSKAGQWHMKVALTARPSNHGCQLISHQTSSCTAGFHWDCTKTSIRNTNTNTQVCFFQSPKSCSYWWLTWGGGMSWFLGTEIIIENIVCKHFFVVCFFPFIMIVKSLWSLSRHHQHHSCIQPKPGNPPTQCKPLQTWDQFHPQRSCCPQGHHHHCYHHLRRHFQHPLHGVPTLKRGK